MPNNMVIILLATLKIYKLLIGLHIKSKWLK